MPRSASFWAWLPLFLAALLTSGCGGRELQKVTLNPPSADAKNFSNGQVPFTATGTFSSSPSPVTLTSKDVVWCIGDQSGQCAGNINPPGTVDQNGVGSCEPSLTGTVTVLAGHGETASANPDAGSKLKIFGSAQLTCP